MSLLTRESIDRFKADGFIVLDGLLSEEEIQTYQVFVRDAVVSRKRYDKRSLEQKSTYEQSFLQCMNLWEDFPDIRPLTFHPKIAQAAAELIGADAVRLWHDQALFKEAGGRQTDVHQDLPYWTMTETDALTAWIPFNGSTLANGCMGYIRGSHINATRTFVDIFRRGEADPEKQAETIMTGTLEYIEVPRGSVAFHHGLTAHGAKPNTSDETREVHTMIFFRDGITRSEKGKHYAVDRAGIQPGEPIASPATPVAWPRTDLPEPPQPMDLTEPLRQSGAFPQQ